MKILFLDESGDQSLEKVDEQFPIFCLGGCIFDEEEYFAICDGCVDSLKMKFFNNTETILHSREIRKCLPPFNILLNKNTKEEFYKDLNNIISDNDFVVLASAIDKRKLKDKYSNPVNPYNLSLHFIMERFLYFLEENNDVGYISIESRTGKSNNHLLKTYTNIMDYGTGHVSSKRFQDRIQKIEFVAKSKNENGHQIADLIVYPIAKFVMNNKSENPAFDIVKKKFRKSIFGRISGYGLKIFPQE